MAERLCKGSRVRKHPVNKQYTDLDLIGPISGSEQIPYLASPGLPHTDDCCIAIKICLRWPKYVISLIGYVDSSPSGLEKSKLDIALR